MSTLGTGDIVVIVIYFVIVLGVALWATWRANRGTMSGYFLAGRNIQWWPVGASLFASNIGSGHFIGLAGTGAAAGLSVASFELNAMFLLLALGWIFVPVYTAAGVYTMPEYLKKRFGGERVRIYLAVVALFLSMFTKISVDLFAGALFIQQAVNWNLYLSIVILLAVTAFYTIAGGLTAVIMTDTVQTLIMLFGAFALMILGFIKIPYNSLKEEYFNALPNFTRYGNMSDPLYSCGLPRSDAFHLFRDPVTSDLPWPGMVFGITIIALWYWCTDQVIVQRALAAKNVSHAKGGCVFAGYLKILPLFLIVFPGMISRCLFPDEIACADPDICMGKCGSRVGCSNLAYPKLVLYLMPEGMRGLMFAVMISALMSSLTSVFNSSSLIFTLDIWPRMRKSASQTELLIVGRVFILVMVAVSILWIPVIQVSQGGRLFDYIQSVQSYLPPPICAVFLLAIFWSRTNEQGAFWGLMWGLLIGFIRLILDIAIYPAPECGTPDNRPSIIKDVHYLYFGIINFLIVSLITIVVSLITKPIDRKHLIRLTFWTRFDKMELDDIKKVGKNSEDLGQKEMEIEEKSDKNEEEKEISLGKKCFQWICGLNQEKSMTPEQEDDLKQKATDISETKKQKIILTINGILMGIASAVFFIVYA